MDNLQDIKDRIECYKEFSNFMEYPVVIFYEKTKEIVSINYPAQVILGNKINTIEMDNDINHEDEDFWIKLHSKKSLIWHRVVLKTNEKTYKVSGLINEFYEGNKRVYMVMFELRSGKNLGSVTLEKIVNNAGIIAFHWYDPEEWKIKYVSKSVNRFGYTSEQFYNRDILWEQLVFSQDLERVQNELKENIKRGIYDFSRSYRVLCESQKIEYVRDMVHIVTDKYNNVKGAEVLIIIEEKRTERRSISRSELEFMRLALDKSNSIVLVNRYSKENNKVYYISPNASRYGIDCEGLLSGKKNILEYIYEEDRLKVIDTIMSAVEENEEKFVYTYRIITGKDSYEWFQDNCSIGADMEGNIQLESLLVNVTEQKRIEENLLKAENGLRKQIEYIMNSNPKDQPHSLFEYIARKELHNTISAYANMSELYVAAIDLEGKPIVDPCGPMVNMGEFYDMFERPEYKKMYLELNKMVTETAKHCTVNFDQNNKYNKITAAPVFIDNVHVCSLLMCSFTEKESIKLNEIVDSVWNLAKIISNYIYNSAVVTKESQKSRLTELKLEEELKRQEIVAQALSSLDCEGHDAVYSIIEQAGRYMDVDRIAIFKIESEERLGDSKKIYGWNSTKDSQPSAGSDADLKWFMYYFGNMKNIIRKKGVFSADIDEVNSEVKGHFINRDIKSIVALPIIADDDLFGAFTIVDIKKKRSWNEKDIAFFRDIRNVVQGIISKRQTDNSVYAMNKSLFAGYDHMDEYVFIKEEYSDEIVYANKKIKEVLGEDIVGKPSCDTIEIVDARQKRNYSQNFEALSKEIKRQCYMQTFNKVMDIVEMPIKWVEGIDARLLILHEHKDN